MKDKILRVINHIYYGVYLYSGEAFYPQFYNGERTYYQGFWGFKFCYVMVFLYAFSAASFIGYCMGEDVLRFINSRFIFKLLYIFFVIGLSFVIVKATSLGGKKGLSFFEQFIKDSCSERIKWMILGALCFIMGIMLSFYGNNAFHITYE